MSSLLRQFQKFMMSNKSCILMGKENITLSNKKILMKRVIRLKLDDD